MNSFFSSKRGNVAIVFALAGIPLAGMVAGAIDFQMAASERRQMQDALDAATLEVMSRDVSGTRADRQRRLQRSYAANGGRGRASLTRDTVAGRNGIAIETSASQAMPTSMLGLVGIPSLNLEIQSGAQREPQLQSLRFRYRYMTGAYDKRISLYGVRPGETRPVELMNIQYTWPNVSGGTFTTVRRLVSGRMVDVLRVACPVGSTGAGCTRTVLVGDGTADVTVEGYERLYLQMTVSASNSVAAGYLWPGMPRTVRSDDPALSWRLFLDGRQVPNGRTVDITTATPCGVWSTQDWEDGGNTGGTDHVLQLASTDVHYDVLGSCGYSGRARSVSLTR